MATLLWKDLFVVGVVGGLMIIGMLIALQSGGSSAQAGPRSARFGNLSGLIVALVSCFAALIMVQELIGFRISYP